MENKQEILPRDFVKHFPKTATLVARVYEDHTLVAVAKAGPKDQWSRKTGYHIAKGRLDRSNTGPRNSFHIHGVFHLAFKARWEKNSLLWDEVLEKLEEKPEFRLFYHDLPEELNKVEEKVSDLERAARVCENLADKTIIGTISVLQTVKDILHEAANQIRSLK